MSAASGKVIRTERAESRLYLAKAREFALAARVALMAGQHDAALLLSVHAAISAGDSVSVALAGMRSGDPDHSKAIDLLGGIARGSDEIGQRAKQMRQLLQKKNLVEYESRRATASEARDAVERATRVVDWADVTVAKARV
jgi:hypothetical protein